QQGASPPVRPPAGHGRVRPPAGHGRVRPPMGFGRVRPPMGRGSSMRCPTGRDSVLPGRRCGGVRPPSEFRGMTLNPVLVHEMRSRMRGGTAYLLLTSIILVFGGFTLATFWAITNVVRPVTPVTVPIAGAAAANQPPPIDRILVAQRGVIIFLVMSLWAIVLTALIVPGTTSGTIARERETHSLPLLLGTPLSPLAIILGKLLAASSYILLVVAAGVPLFS